MRPYIFGQRDNIYIIDLQQTQKQIENACNFLQSVAAQGDTILFVGTKRQAQETIKEEALRCEMPYVITRWLGGTMTNFKTIKKRIDKLLEMEQMEAEGKTDIYTKKELARFLKAKQRLLRNLEGVKHMTKIPKAIFIVDTRRERTAIKEAIRLKIPIIGLIDTNSNPDPIDYCVVGNDDAIKSIRAIVSKIADAILAGKRTAIKKEEDKPAVKQTEQQEEK